MRRVSSYFITTVGRRVLGVPEKQMSADPLSAPSAPSAPSADNDDWVHLGDDPDVVLRECWSRLPINIPFEEFKMRLQAPDRPRTWLQLLITIGQYTSTVMTLASYRQPLLLLWSIVQMQAWP